MTAVALDDGCPNSVRQKFAELTGRFSFSERADRGGSGFVFFGTQIATQRSVAVKFHSLHDAASEVFDLASISSPNVIGVLDAGPVDADWAYFVTLFAKAATSKNSASEIRRRNKTA